MSRNDLAIVVIDDMPLICEAIQLLLLKIGYTDIRTADDKLYQAKRAGRNRVIF
ncbi:MAG: hypothetical protein ACOY4D_09265 [Pseudomonadota bacterium]